MTAALLRIDAHRGGRQYGLEDYSVLVLILQAVSLHHSDMLHLRGSLFSGDLQLSRDGHARRITSHLPKATIALALLILVWHGGASAGCVEAPKSDTPTRSIVQSKLPDDLADRLSRSFALLARSRYASRIYQIRIGDAYDLHVTHAIFGRRRALRTVHLTAGRTKLHSTYHFWPQSKDDGASLYAIQDITACAIIRLIKRAHDLAFIASPNAEAMSLSVRIVREPEHSTRLHISILMDLVPFELIEMKRVGSKGYGERARALIKTAEMLATEREELLSFRILDR